MAASVSALRILQTSFAQGIAEAQGLASRAGRIIMAPGVGTFKVGNGAFGGIGQTLSGTATDASLSDYFTFETSHTMVKKVIKSKVPVQTLRNDYAFEQAGMQLAQSAVATLDKGFFDGLEGLFSAAHPRVGTGAGQVGASKKYLDTGLAYLQGESGAGTQDNLLTTAFSQAAVIAAAKLLLSQRNDRGIPLSIGAMGNLVLVCAPANFEVAKQVASSDYTSKELQTNTLKSMISDVVVYPFADPNDWYLISKPQCPIGIAIGTDPTARISTTTDGLFYELVSEVEFTFFKSPYEYGLVGANVTL
jgi:hypothetical protein